MEPKDVLSQLRAQHGLSQEALAERLFVSRQAVSRWETGETIPNTETLKRLSQLFDVSINTLLGTPRQLICQCCGMPLEDGSISREPDGSLQEDYCKWCYADGKFVYASLEELTEFLVGHMAQDGWPPEQARAYFQAQLPKLKHGHQKIFSVLRRLTRGESYFEAVSFNRPSPAGQLKFFGTPFFQKRCLGSRDKAPWRCPQTAKYSCHEKTQEWVNFRRSRKEGEPSSGVRP